MWPKPHEHPDEQAKRLIERSAVCDFEWLYAFKGAGPMTPWAFPPDTAPSYEVERVGGLWGADPRRRAAGFAGLATLVLAPLLVSWFGATGAGWRLGPGEWDFWMTFNWAPLFVPAALFLVMSMVSRFTIAPGRAIVGRTRREIFRLQQDLVAVDLAPSQCAGVVVYFYRRKTGSGVGVWLSDADFSTFLSVWHAGELQRRRGISADGSNTGG